MNVNIFIILILATYGFLSAIYGLSISFRLKGETAKEENTEILKTKKIKSYQYAFWGFFGFIIFFNSILALISVNSTSELSYFLIAWNIIVIIIALYYLIKQLKLQGGKDTKV